MIDLSNEYGQRVARRLREEPIGWLTTVDRHGLPPTSAGVVSVGR